MVQKSQINQCDTTYDQNEEGKVYDHLTVDAKKNFDTIQYPLMIKIIIKMGIGGIHLNTIKAIYDKPTVNLILNGEKLKFFLLNLGIRQECLLLPLFKTQYWKS